jgi:hypothetical protein
MSLWITDYKATCIYPAAAAPECARGAQLTPCEAAGARPAMLEKSAKQLQLSWRRIDRRQVASLHWRLCLNSTRGLYQSGSNKFVHSFILFAPDLFCL